MNGLLFKKTKKTESKPFAIEEATEGFSRGKETVQKATEIIQQTSPENLNQVEKVEEEKEKKMYTRKILEDLAKIQIQEMKEMLRFFKFRYL